MRRIVAIAIMVSFGASVWACGGGQKEVAVKGKDTELAQIAGEWEGDYQGKESGRTGPVFFSLQLGRHVAEGDVRMGGTTPLRVEFIQLEGNQIKGTIAPYIDPKCACQVETSFLGNVDGDTISGMFETKLAATGQIQTGTWRVTRKAK